MPLKFLCSACDEEIIVRWLKPGEVAKCRNCGAEVVVPGDAAGTGHQPTYERRKYVGEERPTPSLPPEKQAAQDALASFYIGLGGFLNNFSLLSFLWVFVAPYGIKLALRGKESDNRTFAIIGLTLCIVGLVSYGIGLIAAIILVILRIELEYLPVL